MSDRTDRKYARCEIVVAIVSQFYVEVSILLMSFVTRRLDNWSVMFRCRSKPTVNVTFEDLFELWELTLKVDVNI